MRRMKPMKVEGKVIPDDNRRVVWRQMFKIPGDHEESDIEVSKFKNKAYIVAH
jgi:hypothetical protein